MNYWRSYLDANRGVDQQVVAKITRLGWPKHDVEDAFQKVVVRMLTKSITKLPKKPTSYLTQCVANELKRDHSRTACRRFCVKYEGDSPEPLVRCSEDSEFQSRIDARDQIVFLKQVADWDDLNLAVRYFVDGATMQELAAESGVSRPTLKNKLTLVLNRLHALLN